MPNAHLARIERVDRAIGMLAPRGVGEAQAAFRNLLLPT
jgi:hypothetical protein